MEQAETNKHATEKPAFSGDHTKPPFFFSMRVEKKLASSNFRNTALLFFNRPACHTEILDYSKK